MFIDFHEKNVAIGDAEWLIGLMTEGLHQSRGAAWWRGTHFIFAGGLNDLHSFDPASMTWSDLGGTTTGRTPTARDAFGMASTEDGILYVFGGGGGDISPTDGCCGKHNGWKC